jgi:ABC-type antimicrobial peptide transport system permease subunit
MKKYFLTGLRNIRRRLGYALLNVLGLALGIGSCLVIFLIVRFELGYDAFNHKADRTYRINLHALDYNPCVSIGVAPAMRNDFPELEQVTQIFHHSKALVQVGVERYSEKDFAYADEHLPQVFDYQWLEGDARTALEAPNSMVLTESLAKKYFGSKEAMGQVVNLDHRFDCKVTGVIRDLPGNTSIPFNFLVSWATIKKDFDPGMYSFYAIPDGSMAFVVTPEHYPVQRFERRLHGFIEKNWGKDLAKEATLIVQPLRDIHFDQRYLDVSFSPTTSRVTYYALAGIALFIIITACINFINLSTGQAITRAKEVGVRKVLGARRPQLIRQFMAETAMLVLLALVIGLAGSALFLPQLSKWLGIRISVDELGEPVVMALLAGVTIMVILLAGLYPAFVQSAFRPALSLKGTQNMSLSGLTLRKSLVVVQFAISQLLIVGTVVVARQMDFFRNRDLGFNKESVITIPVDSAHRVVLRQQLAANPGITGISFASSAPAYANAFTSWSAPERGLMKDDVTEYKFVDEAYIRLFGLRLLAGDTIAPKPASDTLHAVVVNETMVEKMGFKAPAAAIGRHLIINDGTHATIIGVVADFQSESKHKKRRPCVLEYDDANFYTASLRLQPAGTHQTIADISKIWSGLFPDRLFRYEFLDDHIASLYRQEEKVYTAFRLFSLIAIVIGCLGLYGLIAFATLQRTREVGIRKVLGATVPDILYLFAREFILLIGIAFIISAPLAWLTMHHWLENFAYRISIGWGTFLLSLAVSALIAATTIGYKAVRAAVRNPVKSLRSD